MEIIKDSNNVVLFAGDLQLTESGVTGLGYAVPFCTLTTHSIETVASLPYDWQGGHYSYDGEWVKTSAGTAADNVKLSELKAQKRQEIDTIRYSKIYSADIPYDFPDGADGVQMRDETDRQNIQDMVISAGLVAPETTMYFMPVSNTLQTMTAQDIIDMGLALKTRGDAIMGYSWTLKGQIEAAQTIAAVNAIDINGGWPA